MCLVIIALGLIYLLIVAFFVTARILLPWTVASTTLAGLVALGIVMLLRPRLGKAGTPLAVSLTFILTIVFGYVGTLLVPPQPPPPQPPKDLMEWMVELPVPDVKASDIQVMLPVHLVISGLIGGVITASVVAAVLASAKDDAGGEMVAGDGDVVGKKVGAADDMASKAEQQPRQPPDEEIQLGEMRSGPE